MNSQIPLKRLLRVAVFTSAAIGVITMGPVYLISIMTTAVNATPAILFRLLLSVSLGISFFVFFIWMINIALLYYITQRPFLSKRNNIRYFGSYLVCLLLMSGIRLSVNPILNNPEKIQEILNWKIKAFGLNPGSFDYMQFNNWLFQILIMVSVVVSINTVVLITQELVLLIDKKTRIESENIQLRIKNMEAANQRLKQQLQPHFLFNSLNVLKTLIRKQPDNAEAYLKRLSDFLRASVSLDKVNVVKFEEELKLSLDYIEMQKIRFKDAIHFEVSIPEEVKEGLLPIFSIQLLLENAIKHNAFTIESPLFIKLFYDEGWITVSNNIQQKNADEPSSGMGLINLSERYRILSEDDIDIQSNASDFSVRIKVLRNENSNH